MAEQPQLAPVAQRASLVRAAEPRVARWEWEAHPAVLDRTAEERVLTLAQSVVQAM
jgi:hypothetical protein